MPIEQWGVPGGGGAMRERGAFGWQPLPCCSRRLCAESCFPQASKSQWEETWVVEFRLRLKNCERAAGSSKKVFGTDTLMYNSYNMNMQQNYWNILRWLASNSATNHTFRQEISLHESKYDACSFPRRPNRGLDLGLGSIIAARSGSIYLDNTNWNT